MNLEISVPIAAPIIPSFGKPNIPKIKITSYKVIKMCIVFV